MKWVSSNAKKMVNKNKRFPQDACYDKEPKHVADLPESMHPMSISGELDVSLLGHIDRGS